jgi:hypothetical protein
MPTEKFSYIALRREGGASSGMAACFRGRGHHLIREVDGFEADPGDAKRLAAMDHPGREHRQIPAGERTPELIGYRCLDPGRFAFDIRRQFNSAIIAPRSRGPDDELRIGES